MKHSAQTESAMMLPAECALRGVHITQMPQLWLIQSIEKRKTLSSRNILDSLRVRRLQQRLITILCIVIIWR